MTVERIEHAAEVELRSRPDMIDAATDSWVAVVAEVSKLAGVICNTEFVPRDLRPKANEEDYGPAAARVTAVILHGRELGLPPMTALASTHLIEGKPSISAEVMRALILQAGHEIVFTKTTASECTVKGRRRRQGMVGSTLGDWTEVTWTMADANRAGLTKKTNWQNHPRRMLEARASAELAKLIFADVIHGMRIAEDFDELVDVLPDEAAEQPAVEATETVRRAPGRNVPPQKRTQAQPVAEDQAPPPARKRPTVPQRGTQSPDAGNTHPPASDESAPIGVGDALDSDTAPQHAVSEEDAAGSTASQAEAAPEDTAALPPPRPPQDPAVYEDDSDVTRGKVAALQMHASRLGIGEEKDRDFRLSVFAHLAGLEKITSSNDLTQGQAMKIISQLERCKNREALEERLKQ